MSTVLAAVQRFNHCTTSESERGGHKRGIRRRFEVVLRDQGCLARRSQGKGSVSEESESILSDVAELNSGLDDEPGKSPHLVSWHGVAEAASVVAQDPVLSG